MNDFNWSYGSDRGYVAVPVGTGSGDDDVLTYVASDPTSYGPNRLGWRRIGANRDVVREDLLEEAEDPNPETYSTYYRTGRMRHLMSVDGQYAYMLSEDRDGTSGTQDVFLAKVNLAELDDVVWRVQYHNPVVDGEDGMAALAVTDDRVYVAGGAFRSGGHELPFAFSVDHDGQNLHEWTMEPYQHWEPAVAIDAVIDPRDGGLLWILVGLNTDEWGADEHEGPALLGLDPVDLSFVEGWDLSNPVDVVEPLMLEVGPEGHLGIATCHWHEEPPPYQPSARMSVFGREPDGSWMTESTYFGDLAMPGYPPGFDALEVGPAGIVYAIGTTYINYDLAADVVVWRVEPDGTIRWDTQFMCGQNNVVEGDIALDVDHLPVASFSFLVPGDWICDSANCCHIAKLQFDNGVLRHLAVGNYEQPRSRRPRAMFRAGADPLVPDQSRWYTVGHLRDYQGIDDVDVVLTSAFHLPLVDDVIGVQDNRSDVSSLRVWTRQVGRGVEIDVEALDSGGAFVGIYDVAGRCVHRGRVTEAAPRLLVDRLEAGVYFVKVTAGRREAVARAAIVH